MLRLILAVAAGFLTLSALLVATEYALLRFLFHSALEESGILPPAYLLAYGLSGIVYAVIAGCVTATLAKRYEGPTILGALMLGMGIGGLLINRGSQPIWYAATIPLLQAVIATMAGYRWLRRLPESAPRRVPRR